MLSQMKNNISKNMVIATMAIVGTLLLVSTIINNSSSNMSVNAKLNNNHHQKMHQKKEQFLYLMKKVDLQMNLKNVLNWQV